MNKGDSEQKETVHPAFSAPPGGETILVVEDQKDLRELVAMILESRGYQVIPAGSGAEALVCWEKRHFEIKLLLTDINMPDGWTGQKLADKLVREAPQLRVIFSSGDDISDMPGAQTSGGAARNFLAKPYRPAQLLQMVRECLDQPGRPSVG